MKTMKELLKYKVNKKFIVFFVVLLILNFVISKYVIKHFYGYVFLFSFDYYIAKYVYLVNND